MRIGNAFSNVKLVFFVLFLVLFVGFAIRDIRAGDVSSPLIFLGFLVVIAIVFKPWRTGSDEGTPLPPRDKKPPSSYLLAPLFFQDSLPGATSEACDGWIQCHPIALTVFVIVLAGGLGVFLWGRHRAREQELNERAGRTVKRP